MRFSIPDPTRRRSARSTEWRIDDLAHEADVTVDTIRYYAREGLLPRPIRSGRHKLYSPRHLDRLHRIRELQDRRFSLAAIKAILDSELPGVEELFTDGEHAYDLDELAACSGLDDDLIGDLRSAGVLPDPSEFGRETYGTADLGLLEAAAELVDIGMPEEYIVELARLYAHHFAALERDVVDLLSGSQELPGATPIEEFQMQIAAEPQRLVAASERILHYLHQRTLQRMALQRMIEVLRDTPAVDDKQSARP